MIKISDAEWKIMNVLWEEQPKTMMQITKYGYDVPEKNGEQENHSLCGGRKGKIILFRHGPERSGDSGRAEFLKPGIQGQPGTDDDNHVRAGETYG